MVPTPTPHGKVRDAVFDESRVYKPSHKQNEAINFPLDQQPSIVTGEQVQKIWQQEFLAQGLPTPPLPITQTVIDEDSQLPKS